MSVERFFVKQSRFPAYARLGDKEKVLEQARQAVADYENDAIAKPVAESTLAKIRARFGDASSAIAVPSACSKCPVESPGGDPRFNPYWDPLRKDPRFTKLLAEKEQTGPNR